MNQVSLLLKGDVSFRCFTLFIVKIFLCFRLFVCKNANILVFCFYNNLFIVPGNYFHDNNSLRTIEYDNDYDDLLML